MKNIKWYPGFLVMTVTVILVTSLPKGAVTVTVNNVTYREFGGVWYQPFYSGSEVIFQTVANPTG